MDIQELQAKTPVRFFLWSAANDDVPNQVLRVHGPIISSWQPASKEWIDAPWAFNYVHMGEPGAWEVTEATSEKAKGLPTIQQLEPADLTNLQEEQAEATNEETV